MDIKESKELLTFLAKFGSAIDKSLADGKINFLDIGTIFDPLIVAKAAFEDVNKIPSELADLTNEEAAELVTVIETELEITSERAEQLAEKGLALAIHLVAYINDIRGIKADA